MLLAQETGVSQQHGFFWQVAKVYISIFSNSDAAKVLAVNSLKKLQGYVRTQIAHNMNLRLAPEIRFLEDEAALRGAEVRMVLAALCSLKTRNAVPSLEQGIICVTGMQGTLYTGCSLQPGSSKLCVWHPVCMLTGDHAQELFCTQSQALSMHPAAVPGHAHQGSAVALAT